MAVLLVSAWAEEGVAPTLSFQTSKKTKRIFRIAMMMKTVQSYIEMTTTWKMKIVLPQNLPGRSLYHKNFSKDLEGRS